MSDSSEKAKNLYTIGFYNLENLFDTKDDSNVLDNDFLPTSEKKWNPKRFKNKIGKLSRIIPQIGLEETTFPPIVLGVAEVENRSVLEALVNSDNLKEHEYDIVHYDSPDERGIDTALLYRKEHFKVLESEALVVPLKNEHEERDYTRDILYVKGEIDDQEVHILVNHWPSRRSGVEKSSPKRVTAALKNRKKINAILEENPGAKIIIMGDFNDDPHSESIKQLAQDDLYNPMELLLTRYEGTLNYKGEWNLFDQILISNNFLQQHGNNFRFKESHIFNPRDLQEFDGKRKGNPFRTYVGRKYTGGYSDHFPVYSIFSIKDTDS